MKNSNFLIAGIFNLITSFFWIIVSIPDNAITLTIGMFLIVLGIICITYSRLDVKSLYEKRNIILVFGIILIPFNIISSILLLIETDKIKISYSNYIRETGTQNIEGNSKKEVSKEMKKLDLLLKIGIVMVAISGVMIATTTWDVMTDFIKMILIILIGILFLGLSIFSDKKLKIRGTTITYWLLSMIAFSIAIFMLGNSSMIGNWLSITGEGCNIFIAILILCISIFSYITYQKFDMQSFIYISLIGLAAAIALVVTFVSDKIEVSLLALAVIITAINFIPKSENIEIKIVKIFGLLASFILIGLSIVQIVNMENQVIILALVIIQIINLVNISLSDKRDEIGILSGIGIIALVTATLANIEWNIDYIYKILINRSIILILTIGMSILLVKNNKVRNILLAIFIPLILMSLIFEIDVFVAIYIGCIALSMIIFGFVNKEFKIIYIEGIVILIANLIIQLWELWGLLPVWVYLLLGGLLLIGIVTVKEVKKVKENN